MSRIGRLGSRVLEVGSVSKVGRVRYFAGYKKTDGEKEKIFNLNLRRRVFAAANTLRFTGAEHITAALSENQQSTAEEIVFRFKTEKASRPIFSSHPDKLIRASLEDGKFRVVYSFSNKNTSQVSG